MPADTPPALQFANALEAAQQAEGLATRTVAGLAESRAKLDASIATMKKETADRFGPSTPRQAMAVIRENDNRRATQLGKEWGTKELETARPVRQQLAELHQNAKRVAELAPSAIDYLRIVGVGNDKVRAYAADVANLGAAALATLGALAVSTENLELAAAIAAKFDTLQKSDRDFLSKNRTLTDPATGETAGFTLQRLADLTAGPAHRNLQLAVGRIERATKLLEDRVRIVSGDASGRIYSDDSAAHDKISRGLAAHDAEKLHVQSTNDQLRGERKARVANQVNTILK